MSKGRSRIKTQRTNARRFESQRIRETLQRAKVELLQPPQQPEPEKKQKKEEDNA